MLQVSGQSRGQTFFAVVRVGMEFSLKAQSIQRLGPFVLCRSLNYNAERLATRPLAATKKENGARSALAARRSSTRRWLRFAKIKRRLISLRAKKFRPAARGRQVAGFTNLHIPPSPLAAVVRRHYAASDSDS
jgi:hypothetical protein